jgi:hypothetical protein
MSKYVLTWVILGEPLHRVERRLIMVDTEADDFVSCAVVLEFAPGVPKHRKIFRFKIFIKNWY